jgi:hypothetical protein
VSATSPIPRNRGGKKGYAGGYRRALGISENARFSDDPNAWVANVVKEHLWSKQREINESVVKHRYTAVRSAHDTGKSFDLARLAGWWIDVKPDPFVVTTAPTWKQVNSILWREMRKAHRKGKLRGRINLDAEWYMGSDELVAFGRKPADYDQAAFQGIHALNVLVLIDEACGVPQSIFEAADSLATNRRARVVAIGNPDDPASYFAKVCAPGSGWNSIKISAFDTPAFTDEEVPDELYDYLVSQEWITERERRWGKGSPIYTSKVLGEFPDISDTTLLPPGLIRQAQERETVLNPHSMPRYGGDIARYGDGETVIAEAIDGRVRVKKVTYQQGLMQTAGFFIIFLREQGIRAEGATFNIDVVGLGGGVYDRLIEQDIPVTPYHGGETPAQPELFLNKRAEDYWYLRILAERGDLDLPTDEEDDVLIAQLGSIKWSPTSNGKIKIESKEDMRARGLPSPDRADAVAMACSQGLNIFVPSSAPKGETEILTEDLLDRKM